MSTGNLFAKKEKEKPTAGFTSDKLEGELRSLWNQPYYQLSVVKDLPRLAKRIELEDTTGIFYKAAAQEKNEKSHLQTLVEIVQEVVSRLEAPERVEQIKPILDKIYDENKDNPNADIHYLFKEFFRDVLTENCKTTKLFKVVNQSVIFPATYHLKTTVTTEMTKDVRSSDGWRINIFFGYDVIAVTHFRKEQGMKEDFEFEWELRMSFDKELVDMQASLMRIIDLKFRDGFPAEKRQMLKQVFVHGRLIL